MSLRSPICGAETNGRVQMSLRSPICGAETNGRVQMTNKGSIQSIEPLFFRRLSLKNNIHPMKKKKGIAKQAMVRWLEKLFNGSYQAKSATSSLKI